MLFSLMMFKLSQLAIGSLHVNKLLVFSSALVTMAGRIKLSNFLDLPMKSFKLFGLDSLSDGTEKPMRSYARKFLQYFLIGNMFVSLPCCLVSIVINKNNYEVSTRVLTSMIIVVIALAKIFAIKNHGEIFKETVGNLHRLFAENIDDQNSAQLSEELKHFKRFVKVFLFTGTLALSIFLFGGLRDVFLTGVWIQKFPVEIWFPFDVYDPRYHAFTWLFMVIFSSLITIAMWGADLILFALVSVVSILYQRLDDRIENLKNKLNQSIDQDIKSIVELHNDLITVCYNLQRIFSFSLLINLLGTSIIICTIGFQVVDGARPDNSVKYGLWFIMILGQILSLCFYGSKLSDISENASRAIFYCGWNECDDRRFKHFVMLMTIKSQRPCVLSASKFTTISLKVFKSVNWREIEKSLIQILFNLLSDH